jgi:hypothetical protein
VSRKSSEVASWERAGSNGASNMGERLSSPTDRMVDDCVCRGRRGRGDAERDG